ncbi:hypothetical protein CcrColossus_gp093 [Caulobacter phage CcrColossus]|uniref:Uncharacterized protein n=1 Tax=Caulobacter phage CcrColossus TaxID=1211640 RepID=K4JVT1_9CAUD|nr:hypothetical protein CcrColossus_gp093 [Caulobacter phage CcrColossus]AFU87963.1 hypothetical protein CcrColossus_gp093 [Caulobacter phage CcrColossus]
MSIQNKHSDTENSLPNLVLGQIAVNTHDEVLWVRSGGRRTPIHLPSVQRAMPYDGQSGAPLVSTGSGSQWDPQLAPVAVVDDAIKVDLPPAAGFMGVPGVQISGLGPDRTLPVNSVQIEPFQVRSDQITVTSMAFAVRTAGAGAVRMGIFDADDNRLLNQLFSTPAQGVNSFNFNLVLPRGHYRAQLWNATATDFAVATGIQTDQGWRVVGSDLQFVRSSEGSVNQSSGLVPIAGTPRLSLVPGVDKTMLMRWHL